MNDIWDGLIVGPLMAGLVGLHGMLGSFGLAIIVLTVGIKLVMFPLTMQQIRSAKGMRDVQPLMEEAKRRYGKDKEKLTQETLRIYRENGVNPMMGCLPLLVQMPIWFGLYWALINLSQNSEEFNQGFLWLPSLGQPDPYFILAVLTVVTQFVVQKMMAMPSSDPQQQMMNKVMLFMPLMFGYVAMNVPSGLALYWVTTNIFTFFQQLLTTGWGDLMPNRPQVAAAVAPVYEQYSEEPTDSSPDGVDSQAARAASATRSQKSARHKKRAGAKASGEGKRSNGKR